MYTHPHTCTLSHALLSHPLARTPTRTHTTSVPAWAGAITTVATVAASLAPKSASQPPTVTVSAEPTTAIAIAPKPPTPQPTVTQPSTPQAHWRHRTGMYACDSVVLGARHHFTGPALANVLLRGIRVADSTAGPVLLLTVINAQNHHHQASYGTIALIGFFGGLVIPYLVLGASAMNALFRCLCTAHPHTLAHTRTCDSSRHRSEAVSFFLSA